MSKLSKAQQSTLNYIKSCGERGCAAWTTAPGFHVKSVGPLKRLGLVRETPHPNGPDHLSPWVVATK